MAVLCKHTIPEVGQSNQRINDFEKFITVMCQNHRVVVRHSRHEAAFLCEFSVVEYSLDNTADIEKVLEVASDEPIQVA